MTDTVKTGTTVAVVAAIGFLVSAGSASAQMLSVGDPLEDYDRLLQVTGNVPVRSFLLRPDGLQMTAGTSHLWTHGVGDVRYSLPAFDLTIHDPRLEASWNTYRAYGRNDGAVWQGRGGTVSFSTGASFRAGPLSASLRPDVFYSENRGIARWEWNPPEDLSSFAYRDVGRSETIDMPMRFGPGAFMVLDWGQSYLRADYGGFAAGVSTQNMWWGPALRNAIVMSNNAGGFPHAFLATDSPADIYLGRLEARWFWGVLAESDFFDGDPSNDRRYISGIGLVYEPKWAPGLYLGAARTVLQNWPDRWKVRDALTVTGLGRAESAGHRYHETSSLFARWVHPASGVEVYGEWARGEAAEDFRDMLREPGHGAGYTIGFQKAFRFSNDRLLRFFSEITRLDAGRTTFVRGEPTTTFFYADSVVTQGYTHRGQVLGAGIGPGSNSQSLGVDLYCRWGSVGLLLERIVYDNDAFYSRVVHRLRHMVGLDAGVHGRVFVRGFELAAGFTYDRILNEYYVIGDDATNLHFSLGIRRIL